MCMYKVNATKLCMEHGTNKGFAGKNLRVWIYYGNKIVCQKPTTSFLFYMALHMTSSGTGYNLLIKTAMYMLLCSEV